MDKIDVPQQDETETDKKDVNNDNEKLDINKIIEKQMKAFQDSFIEQFNKEYSDKLDKLKNDNIELESKKQRILISEELRTNGLDGSLIDLVYDDDIEIVKARISQLNKVIETEALKIVDEKFRNNSYIPGGNSEIPNINNENKPKYFI